MTYWCPACRMAGRRTRCEVVTDLPSWYFTLDDADVWYCPHCESIVGQTPKPVGQQTLFDLG